MAKRRRKTQGSKDQLPKTSPKQSAFLAAYATCGLIGKAAKAAGCDRKSHQWWLENDPDYLAKFEEAQLDANEVLEAEARRRAVDGVERMRFYKGVAIIDPRTGEPYIDRDYSDRMLELGLKAHLPEKYTERQKIETAESPLPVEIPWGPGEPEEAFHEMMATMKKLHLEQADAPKRDLKSVLRRAAELKARQVEMKTTTETVTFDMADEVKSDG